MSRCYDPLTGPEAPPIGNHSSGQKRRTMMVLFPQKSNSFHFYHVFELKQLYNTIKCCLRNIKRDHFSVPVLILRNA